MRSNLFFGLSFFTIFVNCGEAAGAGCLQAVLPFSVRGPVGIFWSLHGLVKAVTTHCPARGWSSMLERVGCRGAV